MIGRVLCWFLWIVLIGMAVSFAPAVLRMNRDQQAVVGVFVLCFAVLSILGSFFRPRAQPDGREESLRLQRRRRRADDVQRNWGGW